MKTNITRLVLCMAAALVFITITSGCRNTASGAGKDIENMGEKIQEKAD